MADPTLKDVLDALAQLRTDTKADLAQLRSETKAEFAKIEAKVDAHRAETQAHRLETEKGFRDLDRELTKHADVHRELEKDVESLKRRPARTAARPTRRR